MTMTSWRWRIILLDSGRCRYDGGEPELLAGGFDSYAL